MTSCAIGLLEYLAVKRLRVLTYECFIPDPGYVTTDAGQVSDHVKPNVFEKYPFICENTIHNPQHKDSCFIRASNFSIKTLNYIAIL